MAWFMPFMYFRIAKLSGHRCCLLVEFLSLLVEYMFYIEMLNVSHKLIHIALVAVVSQS